MYLHKRWDKYNRDKVSLMSGIDKCPFCGKQAANIKEYYVCKNCKIVLYPNAMLSEHKYQLVRKYIEVVQNSLSDRIGCIHDIEQKHMQGHALTAEEDEIRGKLCEFHDIRLELEWYLDRIRGLNKLEARKALYRLLMMSDWLNNYLNINLQ